VGRELLKAFKLDETLDREPCGFRKPVFKRGRSGSFHGKRAIHEEVHLSLVVLTLEETLLHESEGEERHEDLLVAFEKTTGDPSEDSHADNLHKSLHTVIIILELVTLVHGLEEEHREGLKGVLVHVVDNTELDNQEVEHSAFSSNSSVDFTTLVDVSLSNLGNSLLLLDSGRSLLGDFKTFN